MDERSIIGTKKYGATMMQEIEDQEKDLNRFLVDVQEELMDALLYIEAAKRCLSDEIEQAMVNRDLFFIGQNGNDGLHYDEEWDITLEDGLEDAEWDEDHALDTALNDMVKDIEVNEETTL